MKFKKVISTIMALVTMALISNINVSAITTEQDVNSTELIENYPEVLEPYAEELEKVNEKLGTEYVFNFSDYSNEDLQEAVVFYTSMSIEEFNSYMTESIEESEKLFNDDVLVVVKDNNEVNLNDSIISPRTSLISNQTWYYNGTTSGNYVTISTVTYYANNVKYYDKSAEISIYSNPHVTTSRTYFKVNSIKNKSYSVSGQSVTMDMNGIKTTTNGVSTSFTKTIIFYATDSYITGNIG
ncbi:MAG: hypothetical protein ACI4WH_02415 [Oscillospiraceae bacterium]